MAKGKKNKNTETKNGIPPKTEAILGDGGNAADVDAESNDTTETQSPPIDDNDCEPTMKEELLLELREWLIPQLGELKSELTKQVTDQTDADTIVQMVVDRMNSGKDGAPKWARLDPKDVYNQCFKHAMDIVCSGQSVIFLARKGNRNMLMKKAVDLSNEMFNELAEHFEIPS